MSEITPGQKFYKSQIQYLESNDVESIVNNYHEDAELVGLDGLHVKGSDALRTHFIGYLGHLGSIKVLSTDKFTETDDSIFFEATVRTDLGIAEVYDVFLLRDGRAYRHYTGVKSVRPHDK